MNITIRAPIPKEEQQALRLLPELADFEVPECRHAEDLWRGDADLLKRYFMGRTPDSFALVAVDSASKVVGVALYTLRAELLSGEPSAHLEMLSVDQNSRQQGVGKSLIQAVETAAKNMGAKSLSLHVFSNNTRARALYASTGFQEELLRCYKPIG